MAKLRDRLPEPELGWKRYDDSHKGLTYTGNWYTNTGDSYYKGQIHVTKSNTTNNYITFKFYGTAIRIIGDIYEHRHSNNTITIDNVTETFSEFGTATGILYALVYEKTGLSLGLHSVSIKSGTDKKNFTIDAIDINEDGYLYGYSLTSPESGWIRIQDTNEKIIYKGEWETRSHATRTSQVGAKIKFYFFGSKIRIINQLHNTCSNNISIKIDGQESIFSEYIASGNPFNVVVFEKTNLEKTYHHIEIIANDNKYVELDAIDIDEDGYLLELTKYLIKQYGKYYSIKPEYYNDHINNFIPLQLEGEIDPNINDIINYGFNDVRNIYNNMTVNNNIFRPIDKLYDRFEIKKYSL